MTAASSPEDARRFYESPRELLVELVGGPADGWTHSAMIGADGLPLYQLKVPTLRPPEWVQDEWRPAYPAASVGLNAEVYRRDRISDETHRWVYEHSSVKPTGLAQWVDVTSPSDDARHQRRYVDTRTGNARIECY